MHLTIAYSKIKKRNLHVVLINNDTYQRETISERPIRQPLTTNALWMICVLYFWWICLAPRISYTQTLHSDTERDPPGSPFFRFLDPYLFLVDSDIIRSVSQASSCHPLSLCNVLMSLFYSSTVIVL